MIRAGILSDTHLMGLNKDFQKLVQHCFAGCDTIIHAGDLTDISLLDAFHDKTVFAVHGNMCNGNAYSSLPSRLSFQLGKFSIGLTHGAGLGHDIESALWSLFPDVHCMIYGHTHQAVCHQVGDRLIINPGSFRATGRYGAPGTYALLEVGNVLQATINEVPQLS
ncbi:MAG: metallophosphoesterase family protein [Deltaproteobacteria bacterium]|nr:metallophosphoesterase family protein [Deltaproteobacteria bacterium]